MAVPVSPSLVCLYFRVLSTLDRLDSMQDVSESFTKLNSKSRLFVVRGPPKTLLPALWAEWGITDIVWYVSSLPPAVPLITDLSQGERRRSLHDRARPTDHRSRNEGRRQSPLRPRTHSLRQLGDLGEEQGRATDLIRRLSQNPRDAPEASAPDSSSFVDP